MTATRAPHRGTIFLEDARVLDQQAFDGEQYILRVEAPRCASHARPGCFVHVKVGDAIALRRPLSIMRANAREGWIEMLYKVYGAGLHALTGHRPGDTLSMLGPIGNGFTLHPERPRVLLVGGGVGIPPMVFLSDRLREDPRAQWNPLVLLGSELPFPFATRPSQLAVPGLPPEVTACMPLLEDWNIPSRLATRAGFTGCYNGFVPQLAEAWLATLPASELPEVEVFCCGPNPMLKATAAIARRFNVACQVSLEEYMACAVGGCAGCTVLVQTEDGLANKRVCVDGPVFNAHDVFTSP